MRALMFALTLALAVALPTPTGADETTTPAEMVAQAKASITELDPAEAQFLIEVGALIVDVREPAEFEAGHIPGAVNIPRGVLEWRISENYEFESADQPILVYCRSGGRGALATQTLQRLGYTGAVSLEGGMRAWEAAGQEISGGEETEAEAEDEG